MPRSPTDRGRDKALPAPAVAPEAYTESYYRHSCMGAETWARSEGGQIDPMYSWYARIAAVASGEVIVDVGCGRGELLVAALEQGAGRAIGVEYAPAAVDLARRTLARRGGAGNAEVLKADARALPLDDGSADVVTMLDVVEHLVARELEDALAEVRRVLRPGGRLLVHTMPNRAIYTVTYPALRAADPRRWSGWPADPRTAFERSMHVNEQTLRSLRRALRRAAFADVRVTFGQHVHTEHLLDERARRLVHRLAAHRATRCLGRADLWARATRPTA